MFIAGGAAVFRVALPLAHRMYLTVVHAKVAGDVLFPEFDPADWRITWEMYHQADEQHHHRFTIRLYERAKGSRARSNGI